MKNFSNPKILFLGLIIALFSGCKDAPKPLYEWNNNYADSVYEYLNQEGDVNAQIENLQTLIKTAKANNSKVPPGLYAQLGLLFSKAGNQAEAQICLDKEAMLFPESKEFIEFLKNQHDTQKEEKDEK